jgi:hypothetical protein
MSGRCGTVGVSDQQFSAADILGFGGHSWAAGDVLSSNSSTTLIVLNSESPGAPITIGVAIDANHGKVWFSRNGLWLNGGNPASGSNATFVMQNYQTIFPTVGIWNFSAKDCVNTVKFSANFGNSSFLYQKPNGFLPLQTNECDCSGSYLDCLAAAACADSDERYVQMFLRSQSCKFGSQYISSMGCDSSARPACDLSFQTCMSQPGSQICTGMFPGECSGGCSCIGGWFDCMWQANCSLDSSATTDHSNMCENLGCSAKDCGKYFQPSCNWTMKQCTSAYLACSSLISSSLNECSCLSQFHDCVSGPGCFTGEVMKAHESLCINRGCSAPQCGYSNLIDFQVCNLSKSAQCDRSYLSCLDTPLARTSTGDSCARSYKNLSSTFGLKGPRFCNDTIRQGRFGCVYDMQSDTCYTPSTCSCVGSYYNCTSTAWCAPVKERDTYSTTCDQIGCTATQCNLAFTICNRTGSRICGGRYLNCDRRMQKYAAYFPANYSSPDMTCYSSYCLWDWQRCMYSANCSEFDTIESAQFEYMDECKYVLGCSMDVCGMALVQQIEAKPDAPVSLLATSLPGQRISVTWNDSLLALQWAVTNSENMLVTYRVSIRDDAANSPQNLSFVEFDAQNQAIFNDLVVGRLYRFTVTAQNFFGMGQAAFVTERLLGRPSQPLNVNMRRTGPLQVSGAWGPPSDFGDGTQDRPLVGYSVLISIHPSTSFSEAFTEIFNVSNPTLHLDSSLIDLNPGDIVYIQVQAVNRVGIGPYSQVAFTQVMGLPSQMLTPVSTEMKAGIMVEWSLPLDTGFGSLDIALIAITIIEVNSTSNASISYPIRVNTTDTCIMSRCSYLIRPVAPHTLIEETVYSIRVFTSNEVGSNADSALVLFQGWRIKTKPTVPLDVIGRRVQGKPLQMQVSWNTPINTGDGTDSYQNFNGYVVQVWDPYALKWAQRQFNRFTLLIIIGRNISQPNAFEAILQAGQVVKVQVAASNDKGLSPFVGPVSALMAGLASTVQNPTAVEEAGGIRLRWSPPLDQGQGTGQISFEASMYPPILVTSYRIVACLETCEGTIKEGSVDASTGTQLFEYFFSASVLGFQEAKVYLNVYPNNDAGEGNGVCPQYCFGQIIARGILLGWKKTPTLRFPTISPTQMLQIAERYDQSSGTTVSDIWEIDSQKRYNTLPITVQDFPLQTVGAVIFIPVIKSSMTRNGRILVSSLNKGAMTDPTDQSGLGSVTVFNYEAPVFSTGSGTATANLLVQSYPTKAVAIYMDYFAYPSTRLVQVSPTRGSTVGGTRVTVTLFEPIGFKTRQGAGLANYYSSDTSLIQITFGSSPGTFLRRDVSPLGRQSNVVLVAMTPRGNVGSVPLFIQVGDSMLNADVSFQYVEAYVYAVSPTASLQSEEFVVTITVSSVGELDPPFIAGTIVLSGISCSQVTIVGTETVIIGGKAENQVILSGNFPATNSAPANILPGQYYPAMIVVTLTRAGGQTITSRDSNFMKLFVPNDPMVLSSTVSVLSRAIPTTQAVIVTIQIRYLRLSADESIAAFFGAYPGVLTGCQLTPCTCPNPCSQFQGGLNDNYLTTVSFFTPIIQNIPYSPIDLPVYLETKKYLLYVRSLTFMSFGLPTIFSVQPTEARAAGGTVLLVGLSGFCDGTGCVPGGFASTFNGQPGRTLGFISLKSWLQGGDELKTLLLIPELSRIGVGGRVEDVRVVQALTGAVSQSLASSGSLTNDTVFLVYLQAPNLTMTQETVVNISIQATDNLAKIRNGLITYFPSPEGGVTGSISPQSQIFLADLSLSTVTFAISLQNFSVSYFPGELQVVLSSADGSISKTAPSSLLTLQSSSKASTLIRLNLPPCGPGSILQCTSGKFLLTISSVLVPTNTISFRLTILDIIYNSDPIPSAVYTSGGDTMAVVWTNVYDVGMLPSEVRVTVSSGDGTIKPGDDPCPNTNSTVLSTSCTYVFSASRITFDPKYQQTIVHFQIPAVPIAHGKSMTSSTSRSGIATIDMIYLSTGQTTAPFFFTYISAPSGPAIFQRVTPTVGSLVGGYPMSFLISNFWRVSNISNLIVTFGSVVAPVQVDGFASGYTFTKFTVLVPPWPAAAAVNVRISNNQFSVGSAIVTFTYFDPFQAAIKYPTGPPWPVGDSTIDNSLQVGIVGLGTAVAISSISVSRSSSSTSFNPPAVTVNELIGSTAEQTDIMLKIPQVSNLQISTDVNITISFNLASSTKSVILGYTYVAAGSPYVISFSPSTYYTDGMVPIEINIANIKSSASLSIQFSPSIDAINASSITAIPGTKNFRILAIIPPSSMAGAVIPVVYQASVQISFPSAFTYLPSPSIVIQRIFPQRGQIRLSNSVSLTLLNFPGFSDSRLSDIVVRFGPSLREGRVVSVTRSEPTLNPMAIQDVLVSLLTPVFTSAASVQLQVYHKSYEERVTLSTFNYEYFNPDMPSISSVSSGIAGSDPQAVYIRTSGPTRVVISLLNVPTRNLNFYSTEASDISLYVNNVQLTPSSFTVNKDSSSVIIFETQTQGNTGTVQGSILFGSNTASNFPDIPVGFSLSFSLQYFDDTTPQISAIVPSTGSELGGSFVQLILTNFPIMSTTAQAIVKIVPQQGGTEMYATIVSIDTSDSSGTQITVSMPAVSVTSGFLNVLVQVSSTVLETKVTNGIDFKYYDSLPKIISALPSSGSKKGGTLIYVEVSYFASTKLPMRVFFRLPSGDVRLLEGTSLTTTADAANNQVSLTLTSPPTTTAGSVDVILYSAVSGPSAAFTFSFIYIDDDLPVLDTPYPSNACILTDNAQVSVYMKKAMSPESQSAISQNLASLTIGTSSATLQTIVNRQSGNYQLIFLLPNIPSPETLIVFLTLGSYVLPGTFSLTFKDCSVPSIFDFNPKSFLNFGGSSIILKVRNLDSSVIGPTSLTSSLGELIRVSATVRSVQRTAGLFTFVTVITPATPDLLGPQNLSLTYASGGSNVRIYCTITLLAPCDFDELCAQQGALSMVAVHALQRSPPVSSACLAEYVDSYCITSTNIQMPQLLLLAPSSGLVGATQQVTASINSFPALIMTSDGRFLTNAAVEITMRVGTRSIECRLIDLVSTGSNFLSQTATLTFAMPRDTDIPGGQVTLSMSAVYGTTGKLTSRRVRRTVNSTYLFIKPVVGAISVSQSNPTSCIASICPGTTLWVQLTNFPYYEMQQPFDTSLLAAFIGAVPCNISRIQSSTAESTSVLISLPSVSSAFVPGSNATLTVIYRPYGRVISGCRMLSFGLCADLAALVFLQILPDPSPALLRLSPQQIRIGAALNNRLISLTVAYFPKGVLLDKLEPRLVTSSSPSGARVGTLIDFVKDPAILDINPIDLAPNCFLSSCSMVQIVVMVPASLPPGAPNNMILRLCLVENSSCVEGPLTFVSYLVTVYPSSVQITPGTSESVDLYVSGFEYLSGSGCSQTASCSLAASCSPPCSCNCAKLLANCEPLSLCSQQPSVLSFQNGLIFQVALKLPTTNVLGRVSMILYNDHSKEQAPFQVQYLQPPPLIIPVDYPTGGTSQITVTAYWGTVVKPVLVSISGAASFTASASATDVSNPAYTVVHFAIPIAATRTDGTIRVTLQAATGTAGTGPAIQVFNMDVFSTPLVQYSEPTQVFLCFVFLSKRKEMDLIF